MQPQCIGPHGLRQFILIVATLLVATSELRAQDSAGSATPTPNVDPSPVPKFTGFIDTTAAQKPGYYLEPGRSLDVTARLGYRLIPGVSIGLLQGVVYNDKVEAPAKRHVYATDTLLRLNLPEFYKTADDRWTFSARIQDMVVVNSPVAQRNTLKNALGARVISTVKLGPTETSGIADFTQNFYAETLNPDGQSNPKNAVTLIAGSDVKFTDKFNVVASYAYIVRTLHNGKKKYLFVFNPEFGYQVTEKQGLYLGIETSDAYLKEFGGVEADYLYQEDLSQAYLRLECKL